MNKMETKKCIYQDCEINVNFNRDIKKFWLYDICCKEHCEYFTSLHKQIKNISHIFSIEDICKRLNLNDEIKNFLNANLEQILERCYACNYDSFQINSGNPNSFEAFKDLTRVFTTKEIIDNFEMVFDSWLIPEIVNRMDFDNECLKKIYTKLEKMDYIELSKYNMGLIIKDLTKFCPYELIENNQYFPWSLHTIGYHKNFDVKYLKTIRLDLWSPYFLESVLKEDYSVDTKTINNLIENCI